MLKQLQLLAFLLIVRLDGVSVYHVPLDLSLLEIRL